MVTIALIFVIGVKSIDYALFNAGELSLIWNAKTLVANFLMLFRGWPYFNMTGINNPTWYLCVLVVCYIAFYFLLYIQSERFKRTLLFLLVVATSFIMHRGGAMDNSLFRGLECFFLGATLCDCFEWMGQRKLASSTPFRIFVPIGAALIAVASVVIILAFHIETGVWQRRILIFGVFVWLLVIAYCLRNHHNKIIQTTGKISFELYIWHACWLSVLSLIIHATGVAFPHSYWTMALFLLVGWLVSVPLWVFVEKPIGKLCRRIERAEA